MRPNITKNDLAVPAIDSAANSYINEAIGNKSDSHTAGSVLGRIHELRDHIHGSAKVYPTLADPVNLITDAAAWTLGALTEIIPVNTITSPFDIHYVSIEGISANGKFELVLYYGPSDIECGRIRFVRTSVTEAVLNSPIMTPILPANSRIRGRVACATGGKNIDVSLFYHIYG